MRLILTTIILTMLAQPVWAEPILTEKENQGYAQACFKAVARDAFNEDFFDTSEGYSYFPSDVEKVDQLGADVSTVIKLKRIVKKGGNKGWGKEITQTTFQYFDCVFFNVAKGSFPKPAFFVRYSEKIYRTPFIRVRYSGAGDGRYGGDCHGSSFCWEPWERWFDLRDVSEKHSNILSYRRNLHYNAAKNYPPKDWIWSKPFVLE